MEKRSLRFRDIPIPTMIGLVEGNGSGAKLLQALLDGHEQLYMIPAYPLLYFYPHWDSWEKQFKRIWRWETIIDLFCEKHASVLDSRKIPGHNGLTTLGKSQNEYISIDEKLFRSYLFQLLSEEKIHRKTFLLAVHYAYSLAKGEELSSKRVLLYHIHSNEYLVKYLLVDFPSLKAIAMIRDPRPNIERRVKSSLWNVDEAKLNPSDAMIYRGRAYGLLCKHIVYNALKQMEGISYWNIKLIRHEDLVQNLETIMKKLSDFIEIDFTRQLLEITFDGKLWWGDKVYGMTPTNQVNPDIISKNWMHSINDIDCYVIEGILFDFFLKYKYTPYKYINDDMMNRLKLMMLLFIPSSIERKVFKEYWRLSNHINLIKKSWRESYDLSFFKDYSSSATYRYKYAYMDLKLWQSRWYKNRLRGPFGRKAPRIIYTAVQYFKYLFAATTNWFLISKRCAHSAQALIRRLAGKNYLPENIMD